MTLLWIDGFDTYGDAGAGPTPTDIIDHKYEATGEHLINIEAGATGNCIVLDYAQSWLVTPPLTNNRILITGFALKISAAPSPESLLCHFYDPSITQDPFNRSFALCVEAFDPGGGTVNGIKVKLGSTSLIDSGSTVDFAIDTWYYIEMKVYCDNSAGTVDVKVDGTDVINGTSLDTQYHSGFNYYARVAFDVKTAVPNCYIDDFYVCDGAGAVNNDFLGTCNVHTLLPDGDGNKTDWTRASGATNYEMLDDLKYVTGNYLSSNTVGHQANVTLEGLTESGSIPGIMYNGETVISGNVAMYAKAQTQNGTGTIQDLGVLVPSTTDFGSMANCHTHIMENDSDGNVWTQSTVNDVRLGVEVV